MEAQKKKTFRNRNLFDYLKNILTLKSEDTYRRDISKDGFDADFKKVVLMRYLSMSPDQAVREVVLRNQLELDRMPPSIAYWYLLKTVPVQRNPFIRYLK